MFFPCKKLASAAVLSAAFGARLMAQTDGVNFPEIAAPIGKIGAGFWESYWLYVLLGVLVLGLVLYIIFRRPPAPKPTPYEAAMLLLMRAKAQPEADGEKKYAERISDAVRGYIGAVCGIPAPEQTTTEFIAAAASSNEFDEASREKLSKMLKLADMAKFAKHSFMAAERDELFDSACDFIQSDNRRRENPKDAAEKKATAEENHKTEK